MRQKSSEMVKKSVNHSPLACHRFQQEKWSHMLLFYTWKLKFPCAWLVESLMVGLLAVDGESIIAKAYTTNHSWIHKHRIKGPNPSLVRIRHVKWEGVLHEWLKYNTINQDSLPNSNLDPLYRKLCGSSHLNQLKCHLNRTTQINALLCHHCQITFQSE